MLGTTVKVTVYSQPKAMGYINALKPELNPFAQRYLTRFFIGILLLEPCISLSMREKPTNTPIINSVY
jgi:hypothetical protein